MKLSTLVLNNIKKEKTQKKNKKRNNNYGRKNTKKKTKGRRENDVAFKGSPSYVHIRLCVHKDIKNVH